MSVACRRQLLPQGLNEQYARELEVIGEQYPFEPLKFLPKTLRLTFAEGIQMLQEAGYDVSGCAGSKQIAVTRPVAPGLLPHVAHCK